MCKCHILSANMSFKEKILLILPLYILKNLHKYLTLVLPENLQKGRRGPGKKIEVICWIGRVWIDEKKSPWTYIDIGTFWAIFCQKTDFGAIFGSKKLNLKIELSHSIFDLETSPLTMLWSSYWEKCEKIFFLKILIFVNFFPTVQIFKSGEGISNYFMIFSQFFFKTQKYRSREDFMPILGEVFFRHHTKPGFSEVLLTSAYAISPTWSNLSQKVLEKSHIFFENCLLGPSF